MPWPIMPYKSTCFQVNVNHGISTGNFTDRSSNISFHYIFTEASFTFLSALQIKLFHSYKCLHTVLLTCLKQIILHFVSCLFTSYSFSYPSLHPTFCHISTYHFLTSMWTLLGAAIYTTYYYHSVTLHIPTQVLFCLLRILIPPPHNMFMHYLISPIVQYTLTTLIMLSLYQVFLH